METQNYNGVEFYQDWEHSDGGIVMTNAKTLNRYFEIKNEQPDTDKYGVFFAFNKEQFEEGLNGCITRGTIKKGDKITSAGAGLCGTLAEIKRYISYYDGLSEMIKKECNPQEVYLYEWNNHECMISGEDDPAMEVIIEVFGKETAHTIKRINAGTPINILAPLTERDEHLKQFDHTLMMLSRFEFDCNGFFSTTGDCRHDRPNCLWAGSTKRQVEVMREYYNKLPDDIKDASPLSLAQINEYARMFDEWNEREFSKDKYDPVPDTPKADLVGLELEIQEKLYYEDDEGKLQTPENLWFSCDSRRWHCDERKVHGLAFTHVNGALYPVFTLNFTGHKRFRLEQFCNVNCSYEYKPLHSRLYKFYRE